MFISVIVCTYQRSEAIKELMRSLNLQIHKPNEVLIIDGSFNNKTKLIFDQVNYPNTKYILVPSEDRGLTKQRNFGIRKFSKNSEIVCFLDDDVILEPDYFEKLVETYQLHPDALGVGGYITNEVKWIPADASSSRKNFYYNGYMREEPFRFRFRSWIGLNPDRPPCFLPTFGHGRSVSFLPPSNKVYPAELFMGCAMSFKSSVFENQKFSDYFEGYGLYEDADFCLRLAQKGPLYVNTRARLEHHHAASGRPNWFKYGKMVMRNGWYVWRVRYPKPNLKARIKWNLTAIILLKLTFLAVFTSKHKTQSLQDGFGRLIGWWSIVFNKPKLER